jgi:choline dehydrogenase-like flavoprotein
VDPKLKVYGTIKLRIVDASILPLEPRGNILATVFADAAKAADIIREEHYRLNLNREADARLHFSNRNNIILHCLSTYPQHEIS